MTKKEPKTRPLYLTESEVLFIEWITDKMTEWIGHDDRIDHGKAKIEDFVKFVQQDQEKLRQEKKFELSDNQEMLYSLYRKARRRRWNWKDMRKRIR